jgi:hypothetical protein
MEVFILPCSLCICPANSLLFNCFSDSKVAILYLRQQTKLHALRRNTRNQNHWASGLCPLSEILNTRKHNVSETGYVSVLIWNGWKHLLSWVPQKELTLITGPVEFLMMDKGHRPSDYNCCTTSSEPFRIYTHTHIQTSTHNISDPVSPNATQNLYL